jgi:hypothetical protein
MQDMLLYTLNTGHTCSSPRAEVCPQAIQALDPVIHNGGPIPGPFDFSLTVTRAEGGALFTVWHGPPLVVCAVAWTQRAEDQLWPELAAAYEQAWSGVPGAQPARKPDRLPWLAVQFLPALFTTDLAVVALLGDLERCVAWAMIEADTNPSRPRPLAKLLKQTGEILPLQPANGRNFTLAELQGYVGGPIQIITPPGYTGAILVINEAGKLKPGALKNQLACAIWHQAADPEGPRAFDDVVGDAVLCHTSQIL